MKKTHLMVFGTLCCAVGIWFSPLWEERPAAKNLPQPNDEGALPNDWFFRQRAYPRGTFDFQVYQTELKRFERLKQTAKKTGGVHWESTGPTNVVGRIADIEMTHDGRLYVGAASGGVFTSSDLGESWTPIFDDVGVLSIGDIGIAPSDERVVYVGTGEANGGGGSMTYPGNGVYKSVDGGENFLPVGLEDTRFIGRVVVHPTDPETVYVAAMGGLFSAEGQRGVFRSVDGGMNWERVLYVSETTGCIDLVLNPERPDVVYAAMFDRIRSPHTLNYGGPGSGIYRSQDGGDSWAQLDHGLPAAGTPLNRIGLAICHSQPEILYAAITSQSGIIEGVYKTLNGGDTWFATSRVNLSNAFASYGDWFGNIRVNPQNPDLVFLLGLDLYFSQDGGVSWIEYHEYLTGGDPNIVLDPEDQIHVDHHAMTFDPRNPDIVINGNDGGVYISRSTPPHFREAFGLPVAQFYTCEIDPNDVDVLYGGAQDNGTNRTWGSPDEWESILGGDGFRTVVDPQDSGHFFSEWQFGNIIEFFQYGRDWDYLTENFPADERRNWNTPIAISPSNPNVVFYGSQRVNMRTQIGSPFLPISGDLSRGLTTGNESYPWGTVTTIALTPADDRVIYAGTDDSNVWVTRDLGANWQLISENLPDRWVTRVAASPILPERAYVTFSGFRYEEYLSHVFKTNDFGTTWQDISGNLPEVPVNDIIIDSRNPDTLIVATDLGVFVSEDDGQLWKILGAGLPIVPVYDLDFHSPTATIVAATYGRSMYRINLDDALEDDFNVSDLRYTTFIPHCPHGAGVETHISLLNPYPENSMVEVRGFGDEGLYLGLSEEVSEAMSQTLVSTNVSALFPEAESVEWIQVSSTVPLSVCAELVEEESRSAYWSCDTETVAYVPHVAKQTQQFETRLAIINTSSQATMTTVRSGDALTERSLNAHYTAFGKFHRDVRMLLGQNLSQVEYLRIENQLEVAASMEYFTNLPQKSQMASLGLNGLTGQTLRFLHVAHDLDNFWTGMVYINVSQEIANVTQRYYGTDGERLAETNGSVLPGGKTTLLVDRSTLDTFPQGTAWMEVAADQPLIGYELFGAAWDSNGDFFAGLQCGMESGSELAFPYFPMNSAEWMGIAVVNTGEESATLTFTLYGADGTELQTTSVEDVAAKSKSVRLARDLFPDAEQEPWPAWIRVEADGSTWNGFALWGDHARKHMSGLTAKLLP